jgi:hypothetical protein
MTVDREYRGAIVIAPPGIFGQWAIQLITDAAAACHPPLRVCMLDRQDAIDLSVAPTSIFFTQFPSKSVQEITESGQLPIVAFIDHAAESLAHQLRISNCTFIDALRATTSAAAINPKLHRGVSTLIFHREAPMEPSPLLERTFEHLALPLSMPQSSALKDRYAGVGPDKGDLEASFSRFVSEYLPLGSALNELTAENLTIVDQALAPLVEMGRSDDQHIVTWASALFLSGDQPNERAPVVANVTGAARIIYYGPYLYLPSGDWEAEMTVGFSTDAIGSNFTIEVYSSELLARARFQVKETGLFKGKFYFTHSSLQDHLELRLRNDQGAIEGRIGLAWVAFKLLGEASEHL